MIHQARNSENKLHAIQLASRTSRNSMYKYSVRCVQRQVDEGVLLLS